MDDRGTAEIVRLCTDGMRNACSMLSAAAWRTAKGMGYDRIITCSATTEPGTSLRVAGWRLDGTVKSEVMGYTGAAPAGQARARIPLPLTYGNAALLVEQTAADRMKEDAHLTHAIRTGRTETAIREQSRHSGATAKPTKQAVATALGLSREHLLRRYGHLFRDLWPGPEGLFS